MNQIATRSQPSDVNNDYERMIPGARRERPRSQATVVSIRDRLEKRKRLWKYLGGLRRRNVFRPAAPRRVLILGAGESGRSIAQTLRQEGTVEVCGFLDDCLVQAPEVLGRIADLEWVARAEFVDEVIVALPGQSLAAWEACRIAQRNHLDIRTTIALPEGSWPSAVVDRIGKVPVIRLHRERLPFAMLLLKRLVDIAGAIAGLVLFGPLMVLLAVAIRLDSRGPVIYRAERIGEKGRRFRCYKFRSMVDNADRIQESLRCRNQRQGPIFKIDDDPRITRVGRSIRRYSLDELPQFWNVLLGDMSLVGPRPHPVEDVCRYELHDYRRLDVKPGMTGLWQVTARKNPSFELSMHLDLTYIENWTLLLDLRILLCTVRTLFAPDGV